MKELKTPKTVGELELIWEQSDPIEELPVMPGLKTYEDRLAREVESTIAAADDNDEEEKSFSEHLLAAMSTPIFKLFAVICFAGLFCILFAVLVMLLHHSLRQ